MGLYNNGKRNGVTYNNKSLKHRIENNQHVKQVRKELLKKKLKKSLHD